MKIEVQSAAAAEDQGTVTFEIRNQAGASTHCAVTRGALLEMSGALPSDQRRSLALFPALAGELCVLVKDKIGRGDFEPDGSIVIRNSDRRHPTFR